MPARRFFALLREGRRLDTLEKIALLRIHAVSIGGEKYFKEQIDRYLGYLGATEGPKIPENIKAKPGTVAGGVPLTTPEGIDTMFTFFRAVKQANGR